MAPRILLTGIPSQYTRLIRHAQGTRVVYSETQRNPETMEGFLRDLRGISNTGNYLIGEGALQALGGSATHIPFWHLYNCCKDGIGLKEIAANFDICVFTCANLLREGLSADAEAMVLDALGLPVVMLGIGIQRRNDLAAGLPAGTLELLRVLKSREHHFLTRGRETAAFLTEAGFSNVHPTGCPSTYFNATNIRTALGRLGAVKVGRARTVFSGYLGANLTSIADINALAPADTPAYYVLQDEHLHFEMTTEPDGEGRVYDPASGELVGKTTFKGAEVLERTVKLHIFFDPVPWRAWTSSMEFNLGRRFHGSIIALQARVPSLMVAVDDRMREMLDYVGLPYIDADVLAKAPDRAECIADHIAGLDIGRIVEQHRERERDFRAALAEIGLVPAAQRELALAD